MTLRSLHAALSVTALAFAISSCGGGGAGGSGVVSTPTPTPTPSPTPSPTPTPTPVTLFSTPPATQEFAVYSASSSSLQIRYDSGTATYEVRPENSDWWTLRLGADGEYEFGAWEPGVWFSIAGTPDGYAYSRLARWSTVDQFESFGIPTPTGAVPTTGTASFAGVIEGTSDICFCNGSYPAFDPVRGSINLAFDFGAGSLSGSIHPILYLLGEGGATTQDLGSFTVKDAIFGVGSTTFSGAFASPASGANGFSGRFTGPHAEEMIGNWALPITWSGDGQDHQLTGAFIGKR